MPSVSLLAEACDKAVDTRKLLRSGIDPLGQRRAKEAEGETAKARATTFTEAAADYIAAHEPSWRSPVHRAQWKNTLASYAEPVIGAPTVGDITIDHILAVLVVVLRCATVQRRYMSLEMLGNAERYSSHQPTRCGSLIAQPALLGSPAL